MINKNLINVLPTGKVFKYENGTTRSVGNLSVVRDVKPNTSQLLAVYVCIHFQNCHFTKIGGGDVITSFFKNATKQQADFKLTIKIFRPSYSWLTIRKQLLCQAWEISGGGTGILDQSNIISNDNLLRRKGKFRRKSFLVRWGTGWGCTMECTNFWHP